jgi:uncharacterized lipoprotein YehR (DUF1307 family)
MKTLFASVLTIVSILSLTSCSQKDSTNSKTTSSKVETSDIKTKYVSELEKSKIFTPVPISYDDISKKLSI